MGPNPAVWYTSLFTFSHRKGQTTKLLDGVFENVWRIGQRENIAEKHTLLADYMVYTDLISANAYQSSHYELLKFTPLVFLSAHLNFR